MFPEEIAERVLTHNKIPGEVSLRYLNLYVGKNANWIDALKRLRNIISSRHSNLDEEELATRLRQGLSFAILLPVFDRSTRIDPDNPENHLFRCQSYSQLDSRDWFNEFKLVLKKDMEIAKHRKKVMNLGVIDAVEYHPLSRQAYRWLRESAVESGLHLDPELEKRFYNFVMTYGGAIITYIYEKHQKEIEKKVINWNSAYFFERLIYDAYKPDQVLKIKQNDINNTNPQWVKTIR